MLECIIPAVVAFFNQIQDIPVLKIFFVEKIMFGLLKMTENSDSYIEVLAPLICPAINAFFDLQNKDRCVLNLTEPYLLMDLACLDQ